MIPQSNEIGKCDLTSQAGSAQRRGFVCRFEAFPLRSETARVTTLGKNMLSLSPMEVKSHYV